MNQSVATFAELSVLSDEIRDGLLQDLVAVGLILRHRQQTVPEDTSRRLAPARATLEANVRKTRGLIDRLRAAA